MKKKITIEDLAAMVAKGFEKTATKDETATKDQLAALEATVATKDQLAALEVKVDRNHRELLEKISAYVPYSEFETLLERVEDIEKFVGIKDKNSKRRQ